MRFALEMNFKKALWFGIFHSISAFNNSGFTIFEHGLIAYKHDIAINLIITSLIIIGGLGYFVLVELYFFKEKIAKFKPTYKNGCCCKYFSYFLFNAYYFCF